MSAYQYYKGLPGWAKGTVIVGGAVIVVLVGINVYNTFKKALAPAPVNLQEAKDAVTTLTQLAGQGILPTNTDAQFQGFVSDLVTALGGCWTTTSKVESVFSSLNNIADVYKLIAVFGNQDVPECAFGSESLNLSAAMNKELSGGELVTINSILATKNIAFTF